MKRIFISLIALLSLQNIASAIDTIPSWNDFAPSVIQPEYQAYWDARYREFESDLSNCKALPAAQRSTCFNQLAINERDKNNKFNDIINSSNQLYNLLKTESRFKNFYKNFVQNMCYDLYYNNFTFEQALENFKEICNVLTELMKNTVK